MKKLGSGLIIMGLILMAGIAGHDDLMMEQGVPAPLWPLVEKTVLALSMMVVGIVTGRAARRR